MGRKRDKDFIPPLDDEKPVVVPITEELDLHTFKPSDARSVVNEYIDAAINMGFEEVRIIHGKGTGALRETVHGALDRHRWVASYSLAPPDRGAWGATIVKLRQGQRRR